ncbi:MAG: hypothetical protein QXR73_00080 [Candidatus Micrarchaeaceae archaeon]
MAMNRGALKSWNYAGKGSSKMYKFIIDKPKRSANPEALAEYLIRKDSILEVDVSDSDNYRGLLVKARFLPGRAPVDVCGYMHSMVDKRYGAIKDYISK